MSEPTLVKWGAWHGIIWLCDTPHTVPEAEYRSAPYRGTPYGSARICCTICGAPATSSCTVPRPHHDDPPEIWEFWPWEKQCHCGTCREQNPALPEWKALVKARSTP